MIEESYLPSPDEIAEACAEIRAGWSDDERHNRTQKTPPMLRCDFVGIQAMAEVKLEDRLAAIMAAMAAMKA